MSLAGVDLFFCGTVLLTVTAGSFGMVISSGGEQPIAFGQDQPFQRGCEFRPVACLPVGAAAVSNRASAGSSWKADSHGDMTHEWKVDNDVLNSSPPARISGFRAKDWIKISQAPPPMVNTQFGERVELECEVLGSPAPEIQWFRGNQMVQQTERGVHNNELSDSYRDKAGLAKIKSRLVIDCVTEKDQGFYVCVARAGAKKIKSQPSALFIEGGNSDACKEPEEQRLQPPRIVSWNPTAMENMGVDVLLPCSAVGNPPPDVYWLDQDNNVVNNFRYRVLNNGDLAIYRLAWPDMGQYKCVAKNSLGSDSVNTFIYPVMMLRSAVTTKCPPRRPSLTVRTVSEEAGATLSCPDSTSPSTVMKSTNSTLKGAPKLQRLFLVEEAFFKTT